MPWEKRHTLLLPWVPCVLTLAGVSCAANQRLRRRQREECYHQVQCTCEVRMQQCRATHSNLCQETKMKLPRQTSVDWHPRSACTQALAQACTRFSTQNQSFHLVQECCVARTHHIHLESSTNKCCIQRAFFRPGVKTPARGHHDTNPQMCQLWTMRWFASRWSYN